MAANPTPLLDHHSALPYISPSPRLSVWTEIGICPSRSQLDSHPGLDGSISATETVIVIGQDVKTSANASGQKERLCGVWPRALYRRRLQDRGEGDVYV